MEEAGQSRSLADLVELHHIPLGLIHGAEGMLKRLLLVGSDDDHGFETKKRARIPCCVSLELQWESSHSFHLETSSSPSRLRIGRKATVATFSA